MLQSPLRYCHSLLSQTISTGDHVIDATVGNGNDTVKLAQLVGSLGKVYGFDIQEIAIEETKKKLLLTGFTEQVELFCHGHEEMDRHLLIEKESCAAVVFNLGYLPKGDKSIVTVPETTLLAIKKSLKFLRVGGLLLLMIYHGHEGGLEEKEAVLEFVKDLPQEQYQVLQYGFVNQVNAPPFLIAIEKRKTD